MAILSAISLIACASGFALSYINEPSPNYLLGWGPSGPGQIVMGNPPSLQGSLSSELKVDGALLGDYKGKYKIMGICFHHTNNGDVLDERDLSKSGLIDIEPRQIIISIPWNQKFIHELASGFQQAGYDLLALPLGVAPGDFDTVRQAIALGAIRLQRVSGPP